jgi:hypothetical protein
MNASYKIIVHGDSPDFQCKDKSGNKINLEIVLTEDHPGDIKAMLGRSEQRSKKAFEAWYKEVKQGKRSIFEWVSCLSGNVSEMVIEQIQKKLKKNYGPNTALVIRHVSGVDWGWDAVVENIKNILVSSHNPYDKGIWIISNNKDRIFRVL